MKVADFRKKLKESLEQELAEGESVTHMLLYLNEETFIDEPGELLAEEARRTVDTGLVGRGLMGWVEWSGVAALLSRVA